MRKLLSLLLPLLFLWGAPAAAQSVPLLTNVVSSCGTPNSTYSATQNRPNTQDTNGNLCTAASGSASVAGFAPNGQFTSPLSVSNVTGNIALPTGAVVLVQNTGSNVAYVNLGTSNAVTATTSMIGVPAGGGCALTVGSNTYLAAITASSTTTLNLSGGANLANTCFGGGSSGGGSNAAASATGAGVPASASYNGVNVGGTLRGQTGVNPSGSVYAQQNDLASVAGTTVSTGTGAQGAGAQRVTVATDTATIAGSAPGTAGTASANVVTVQGVTSMTKLLVTPDANSAVNVAQVNGTTTQVGSGTASTGSQRVAVGQDTATIAGSAPGTAGSASAQVVTVQGVTSMTKLLVTPDALPANQTVNLAQVGGTNTVNGGVAGSLAVGGNAANNATTGGNPVQESCLAANAEPTLATNGQNASCVSDLAHKLIVSPYANKENFVSGTAAVTNTTSTSLVGVPGANLFLYITSVQCMNSGATGVTVSLQNGSGGTTIWEGYALNGGGGFAVTFPVPLGGINNMTANTALFFAAGGSTTTLYCSAQGYKGS